MQAESLLPQVAVESVAERSCWEAHDSPLRDENQRQPMYIEIASVGHGLQIVRLQLQRHFADDADHHHQNDYLMGDYGLEPNVLLVH